MNNQELALSYVFDPADEADGVSVHIPLAVLNQFSDEDFEFLVPGLLEEKVEALIRSLPKHLRKNFIPVPDFARACVEDLDPSSALLPQLTDQLQRMTGVRIGGDDWQTHKIDTHFMMRYCIEEDGTIIASGRSLRDLKDDYADRANREFEQQVQHDDTISRQGLTGWDFDTLPVQVQLEQQGRSIRAFPALVDYQTSVAIELFETPEDARFYHATGIARLIFLQLKETVKYASRNIPHIDQAALMYIAMDTQQSLTDDILMAAIFDCFLSESLPQNRQQFDQCINEQQSQLLIRVNETAQLVFKILSLQREVRALLEHCSLPDDHVDDMREQLEYLVYAGFVRDISTVQLKRIPVYLQAMIKRIQKSELDILPVEKPLLLFRSLWEGYLALSLREGVDLLKLEQCRWMLEEFRINCFAQPMKTRVPVSENKIRKLMGELG